VLVLARHALRALNVEVANDVEEQHGQLTIHAPELAPLADSSPMDRPRTGEPERPLGVEVRPRFEDERHLLVSLGLEVEDFLLGWLGGALVKA
jgi:hypothetical protein